MVYVLKTVKFWKGIKEDLNKWKDHYRFHGIKGLTLLKITVSPKFPCWNSNLSDDDKKRQGLWQVIEW